MTWLVFVAVGQYSNAITDLTDTSASQEPLTYQNKTWQLLGFQLLFNLPRIYLLLLFRGPNAVHVFNKYIGIDFIPIYLRNSFIFLSFEITVSHKQPLHE